MTEQYVFGGGKGTLDQRKRRTKFKKKQQKYFLNGCMGYFVRKISTCFNFF